MSTLHPQLLAETTDVPVPQEIAPEETSFRVLDQGTLLLLTPCSMCSTYASQLTLFIDLFNSEASIASRLGKANPLPKESGAQGGQSSSGHGSGRKQTKPQPKQTKQQTKPKTVEELDAEMDTYMGDA